MLTFAFSRQGGINSHHKTALKHELVKNNNTCIIQCVINNVIGKFKIDISAVSH
jgi:hypothetical protein